LTTIGILCHDAGALIFSPPSREGIFFRKLKKQLRLLDSFDIIRFNIGYYGRSIPYQEATEMNKKLGRLL
jgi:hypothetical protein